MQSLAAACAAVSVLIALSGGKQNTLKKKDHIGMLICLFLLSHCVD